LAKSNFIVRGGADFSGIKKELTKTQKQLQGFKSKVSGTMKAIGAILGSLAIGKLVKDSAQMAMGVETAIQNVNHNMGQAAAAFQDWVETQSKSLGMAKADAYNYGSTFSNLLSSFTTGAQETADQTQELMKAAAIIASRTGRTYDDVANRIRSGMLGSTEAIEDLGVYTNISMIESTEAFRRFAGDKSWAQLDFQLQQQIRLAAILEQTYARYGDTLADTTQTRQAQFIASLKNIQLSLGQAFLPIYNAVLPALTAMANAIGRVINLIAQFVTALFGAPKQAQAQASAIQSQANAMKNLGSATTGAGKAAKKAGKEAKGALAPFDEINQLSKKSSADTGGSGVGAVGGGGAAIEMPAMDAGGFASSIVEVSDKVKEFAADVKEVLDLMKEYFKENKTSIISILAGIGAAIGTYLLGVNWGQIAAAATGAMEAIGAALAGISWPIAAVAALIALVVAAVVDLWQTNEEFRNKIIEAWNGIKDTLKNIWTTALKPIWEAFIDMLLEVWNDGIKPLWDKWKEYVKSIVYLMIELWNGMKPVVDWIIKTFGPVIVEVFKSVFNQVKNIIKAAIDIISSIIDWLTGVVNGIRTILKGLINFVAGVFTGDWRRAWDGIKTIFSGVKTVISSVWNGIRSIFVTIINYVKGTFRIGWSTAWNSIKTVFSNVFNSLKGIVRAPLNFIIDAVNKVIRGINKFKINIPGWVASIAGIKGGSIGFNIPAIPRLDTGTNYVPHDMLAYIHEGEAVVPKEFNPYAGGQGIIGSDRPIELIIQLGSLKIFHEIINGINQAQRQAGKTLINV
jgi:phage-related protein